MYQTTSQLNAYFLTKMYHRAWDNASEENRTRAAMQGSSILNLLDWDGDKTDSNQVDAYPRTVDGIDIGTPQEILDAHAECVYALLDGVDPAREYDALFVTHESFSSVRSTYDQTAVPEHIVAGIPSVVAWRLIKPYLRAAQSVKLSRV